MQIPAAIKVIYKAAGVILVTGTLIAGLMTTLPELPMLEQTSRNVFFHIPMWYSMLVFMLMSLVYSIRFLSSNRLDDDFRAANAAGVAMVFGLAGLVTGILWSRVTWGAALPDADFSAWWSWDPKITSALILLLIYMAYFLLRRSFDEPEQKARIASVYNIFAAASVIPLMYVIPKMLGGLHPGSGGDMSTMVEMNSKFRMILYPAALGFILVGLWMWELNVRYAKLREKTLTEISR